MTHQQMTFSQTTESSEKSHQDDIVGTPSVIVGIQAEGLAFLNKATAAARAFETFHSKNVPSDLYDFGTVRMYGQTISWKVGACDQGLEFGSENPTIQAKTHRILTILVPVEY